MNVEQRVAKGIALLDRRQPNWQRKIIVKSLIIDSYTNCVLCQIFETYSNGLRVLRIKRVEDYGFYPKGYDDAQLLQTEWLKQIRRKYKSRVNK